MKLDEKQRAEIKQIMEQTKCPYDYLCEKSDFEQTCGTVRSIAATNVIECTDKRAKTCPFGLSFGYSYFCKCPVRLYLHRELHV